ncbi:MAG: YidC/Oxa1 family membrane protein insertase [Patescibacteria group bacterium]|nr:YidC/Oxa1 family membrane protein insertase [Patescibacteria group bacterium]
MEIFTYFWHYYLFIPLFNLLIWLYLNYSSYNLGIAIILLTVAVRIILLPFTILTERGKIVSEKLAVEVKEIKRDYSNDPVKQKIMIRRLLKKRRIRPWSKAVSLGFQALILVLLYQVFIGGINTEEKIHLLYPSIPYPDFINTHFLWFNIAARNLLMSAVVSAYLFADILISAWERKGELSRREQLYMIFFPAFVFLALAVLPAAKSIFVLTSLVFSTIISMFTIVLKTAANNAKKKTINS